MISSTELWRRLEIVRTQFKWLPEHNTGTDAGIEELLPLLFPLRSKDRAMSFIIRILTELDVDLPDVVSYAFSLPTFD